MSFLWYSMGWASSGAISTASLIFQIRAKTATALQLVRQFAAGERLPLTFFLSSGLLEEPEADGILGSNRSLRAALQGKGYPLHYREFPGGHDYAAWSLELAEGLQALLPAH